MSIIPIDFIREFRRRVCMALLAVLLTFGPASVPSGAVADQLDVSSGFSLQAFCADPNANFGKLHTLLRPLIGLPTTNSSYDEIFDGVVDRLDKDCRTGRAARGVSVNLDLYARNSRIDAYRKNRAYEFEAEILDTAPPTTIVSADEILDVIQKKATPRQQMVFAMLVNGMTHQEIHEHLGVAIGTVAKDKTAIADLLKEELGIRPRLRPRPQPRSTPLSSAEQVAQAQGSVDVSVIREMFRDSAPAGEAKVTEPNMTRMNSLLGPEILAVIKDGAAVLPTGGGYAGTVMTVKVPRSKLSVSAVDGVVMLPVPVVLGSNMAGEQEMVVAAAREIGEGDENSRTFALYAFCKDEDLETPSDLSRYSFKSEVTDARVVDIVSRSDLRKPEDISERLWALSRSPL